MVVIVARSTPNYTKWTCIITRSAFGVIRKGKTYSFGKSVRNAASRWIHISHTIFSTIASIRAYTAFSVGYAIQYTHCVVSRDTEPFFNWRCYRCRQITKTLMIFKALIKVVYSRLSRYRTKTNQGMSFTIVHTFRFCYYNAGFVDGGNECWEKFSAQMMTTYLNSNKMLG